MFCAVHSELTFFLGESGQSGEFGLRACGNYFLIHIAKHASKHKPRRPSSELACSTGVVLSKVTGHGKCHDVESQ
jgi:hypothetical protein